MEDCYQREGKVYCACKIGFTGSLCDQPITPCSSSLCNEGTCIEDNSSNEGYRCVPGGRENITLCDSSKCSYGEICVNNGSSGYDCKRSAHQQGRNQTPCDSGPCSDGQICVNQRPDKYRCQNSTVKESDSSGM